MAEKSSEVWHKSLTNLPVFACSMLENYIEKQRVLKVKSDRGYKFFLEGYVHMFEVCEKGESLWAVRSKCFHSQKKNSTPHSISVHFRSTDIERTSCSCVAGRGLCHHTIAVLYQLQHFQKLGLKAVPPIMSKTSLPQKWHIPSRTEGLTPKPAACIRVQKSKKSDEERLKKRRVEDGVASTVYNAVQEPLQNIRLDRTMNPVIRAMTPAPQWTQLWSPTPSVPMTDTIFGPVPKGSLLSYQLTDHTSPMVEDVINVSDVPYPPQFDYPYLGMSEHFPLLKEQQFVFDGLQLSPKSALELEIATRDQSLNTKWHNLREQRITSSNFKRVCSRRADFESLAKNLKTKKTVQTQHMLRGLQQEPVAAKHYADTHGRNVYCVGFVINPTAHFLGCSPDRRVYDPEADPNYGLLEIKCPAVDSIAQCKYLKLSQQGLHKLKKSHEYYFQVMGQMGLTGSKWCDFYVSAHCDFHLERIYFDEYFFNEMKQKLDSFYFTHFLPLFA